MFQSIAIIFYPSVVAAIAGYSVQQATGNSWYGRAVFFGLMSINAMIRGAAMYIKKPADSSENEKQAKTDGPVK